MSIWKLDNNPYLYISRDLTAEYVEYYYTKNSFIKRLFPYLRHISIYQPSHTDAGYLIPEFPFHSKIPTEKEKINIYSRNQIYRNLWFIWNTVGINDK